MGVVQRRLAVPNVRQLVGREMLLVECRSIQCWLVGRSVLLAFQIVRWVLIQVFFAAGFVDFAGLSADISVADLVKCFCIIRLIRLAACFGPMLA